MALHDGLLSEKVIDRVGKFPMPAPARSVRRSAAERPRSTARRSRGASSFTPARSASARSAPDRSDHRRRADQRYQTEEGDVHQPNGLVRYLVQPLGPVRRASQVRVALQGVEGEAGGRQVAAQAKQDQAIWFGRTRYPRGAGLQPEPLALSPGLARQLAAA